MLYKRDKISNSNFNITYTYTVIEKFIMYGCFYWYVLYPLATTSNTFLAAVSFSITSLIAMYFIYITTFTRLYKEYGTILTEPENFYQTFMKTLKIILIIQFILSIAFNIITPLLKTIINELSWAKNFFPVAYDNNNIIAFFDVVSALLYFAIVQHIFKYNFENLKSSYTFSITPTLLILSILFTFTSIGTTYLESFRTQAKEAAELEEVLKDEDSPFLFLVDPSQRLKNKYFSSALTYVFSENETYSTNPYIDILKKYTNPGTEDEKVKDLILPENLPNGAPLDPSYMELTYIDNENIYFVYPSLNTNGYNGNLKPSFYCLDKTTNDIKMLTDVPIISYNYSGKIQSTTFDFCFIENDKLYISSFDYINKNFKNILETDYTNHSGYKEDEIKKIGNNFITLTYDIPDDIPDNYYDTHDYIIFYYNNKKIFRYNEDKEIDLWFPTEKYLVIFDNDKMYKIPYQNSTLNKKPQFIETPFSTSYCKTTFYAPNFTNNKYIINFDGSDYYELDTDAFSLKALENIPDFLTWNDFGHSIEFYNCNQDFMILITNKNHIAVLNKNTLECVYSLRNGYIEGKFIDIIKFIKFDIDGNLMIIKHDDTIETVSKFLY